MRLLQENSVDSIILHAPVSSAGLKNTVDGLTNADAVENVVGDSSPTEIEGTTSDVYVFLFRLYYYLFTYIETTELQMRRKFIEFIQIYRVFIFPKWSK